MTEGRTQIEYKVGVRFCDTGAESTRAVRKWRKKLIFCEILVQLGRLWLGLPRS
jgi:hypothetical protein